MRKRENRKRTRTFTRIFHLHQLAHTYEYSAAGEDLPIAPSEQIKTRAKLTGAIFVPVFLCLSYVFIGLDFLLKSILASRPLDFSGFKLGYFSNGLTLKDFQLENIFKLDMIFIGGISFLLSLLIAVTIVMEIRFKSTPIAYGQKGDSRLLTLKELKEQFKAIPEAGESFPGYGGTQVAHYKHQYFIEDGAYNAVYVGTSRSGKGQTAVISLLDILSRAEKQCSLVVGDPKGELYAASAEQLEKRGFDVYSYNLIKILQGMGDDPLAVIKKYYKRGNVEYALQLVNTLTYSIYDDPQAGENKFFNETAAAVVNAIILAILEDCQKSGEWEKCTMNNVAEMLNELGGLSYKKDPDDPLSPTVNALDEYFNSLPPGHIAKKQYGATNFAGEKAKGSILATVSKGLQPFTMPSLAKMTSRASIDLKSVGFQKYIDFKVNDSLINKRVKIRFLRGQEVVGVTYASIGTNGYAEVNFDFKLKDNDVLEFIDPNGPNHATYSMKFSHEPKEYQVMCEEIETGFDVEKLEMKYSDRPVAIFLMIPDSDPSNHVLASIFLSQLYVELSYQCSRTAGNKCFRRVQFVLDEFGNLPAISNMDQILTVTNGRNMLWHLFVQAYSQINDKYGDKKAETIKQNCQTRVLIFTTDDNSIEEFSKAVGNRTVEGRNVDIDSADLNKSMHGSAEAERILTYERLSQLLEGETVVLRPLHRRDLKGNKVRPFPIFNQKETTMPYAYQFLTKYGFDPGKDINSMKFDSPNATLDLEELRIDFRKFLVNDEARMAYEATMIV